MIMMTIDGRDYQLPGSLNDFQLGMYVHLINWKWQHITREPGTIRGYVYDAALPDSLRYEYPTLYPPIVDAVKQHQQRFPFNVHLYFNHMASSQAANLNLFLPILLHPQATAVLKALKPDLSRLATEHLDHGYRIEFWDEPFGNLGDKMRVSGTDADIAIAYYNHQNQLCLWLIEHKLTENKFTACGGSRSKGRGAQHDCSRSFSQILADRSVCYYHDPCKYNYWNITAENEDFFLNHGQHASCPFRGGMNQLWRNQLLALSVERDPRQLFQQASFSVVRHPKNSSLEKTIHAYRNLIADNPKFSTFSSADVIGAAAAMHDKELDEWIHWYKTLYDL